MKRFTALLLLAWLLLVGCSDSRSAQESGYTKTIMVWNGASAEKIRDELLVLPQLRRAVVYDGEATLFHKATIAEVENELEQAGKRWSNRIQLSEVQAIGGTLPEPPQEVREQRLVFHANRDSLAQYGITLSDLAEQLGDGTLQSEENTISFNSEVLKHKKSITTSEGLGIPLQSLGSIELEEITRPLIIEMVASSE